MRLVLALRDALRVKGSLTLHSSDLDGLLGATRFRPRLEVHLDERLTDEEWTSTLLHELLHARRGPVPRLLAATEEIVVRHEAARVLIPDGPALAMMDRSWSTDDVVALAARRGVDYGTAADAVNPPTIPLPAVIPLPRDPQNRWS